MQQANIQNFHVMGDDSNSPQGRKFNIDKYSDNCSNELNLLGPSEEMIKADVALLQSLTPNPNSTHTYPIPSFYLDMFEVAPGGSSVQLKQLSQQDLLRLARCRLGEYIINECM
jgi:hypothetical protein